MENLRVLPVRTPQLQTKDGRNLRKEGRPEAAVYLKKSFEDRARIALMEVARVLL